jgi:DNA-binding SARP family transcriptional activator/tetratricopeptide (TPR) repeat protein
MLTLSVLGPMQLHVDGVARPLPASRKTRALLAFLALEPRRHRRERLCELLWDIPDDPRAALRWSLTKLRPLLDRHDRLQADRDDVALATEELLVDVAQVRAAVADGLPLLAPEQLEALFIAANQTFLAGSDLPAQPLFDAWIGAVRREMADAARALGEAMLARSLPVATHLAVLARMIEADPHDASLHGRRIALLEASGDPGQAAQATSVAHRLVGEVSGAAVAEVAAARREAAITGAPAGLAPARAAVTGDDEETGVLARVIVQPFAATGHPAFALPLAQMVQAGLADALARFGNIRVLGVDPALPVSAHVVSGSLVQSGTRVRVRCRVTDPDGQILWTDEFNREGDDLIALEEELIGAIVTTLEARIRFSRAAQARERPAVSANTLFLRALHHMMGDGNFLAVNTYLEQALALEPAHGLSGAYLPWAAVQLGRISSVERARHYAAIAREAVHNAPDDVMVQSIGGLMYFLLSHDFEGGLAVIERALRLQPHFAFPWLARAWVRIHAGDSAGALADFDRADQLSLADPTDIGVHAGRAMACFQAGDLDAAALWVKRSLVRSRASLEAMRVGIVTAVEQGRLEDARAMARELLARSPTERANRSSFLPFRHPGMKDRLKAAYSAAGIPD